jgi:hypothetical protein
VAGFEEQDGAGGEGEKLESECPLQAGASAAEQVVGDGAEQQGRERLSE